MSKIERSADFIQKEVDVLRYEPTPLMSSEIGRYINLPNSVMGLKILDIGAGTSPCVAELTSRGASVVAIDTSYGYNQLIHFGAEQLLDEFKQNANNFQRDFPSMQNPFSQVYPVYLEAVQRFFRDLEHDRRAQYVGASASSLPLKDNTFDFAYSVRALNYHLINPEVFIASAEEAVRVLKPGGRFQVSPWSIATFSRSKLTIDAEKDRQIIQAELKMLGLEYKVLQAPKKRGQLNEEYLELRKK